MHAEIQTIFLIPTAEDFHPAFERHFQVNPIFRVQFANDNLLWDIRKAFLWEYSAEHADLLGDKLIHYCLLYTSPSPRDRTRSRMPSSA